jgi:hypothetical protein
MVCSSREFTLVDIMMWSKCRPLLIGLINNFQNEADTIILVLPLTHIIWFVPP